MAQPVRVRGIPRRPATPEQLAELRSLGYARISFVYSSDEADRILSQLRAEKAAREAQEAKQAPLLLTAWQRGEAQLDHYGYTVEEMIGTGGVCYEVQGGAEPYHVCIDSKKAEYGCSCPDGILRGDKRPCKHFLAVCVQLWRWAQESTDDYTEWLERYGIMALYRAGRRQANQGKPLDSVEDSLRWLFPDSYKPVVLEEPAPVSLFGEDDGQDSGGASAIGVL